MAYCLLISYLWKVYSPDEAYPEQRPAVIRLVIRVRLVSSKNIANPVHVATQTSLDNFRVAINDISHSKLVREPRPVVLACMVE